MTAEFILSNTKPLSPIKCCDETAININDPCPNDNSNNSPNFRTNTEIICGSQSIDRNNYGCCGSTEIYNLSNEECCSMTSEFQFVTTKGSCTFEECGPLSYDSLTHECCDDRVGSIARIGECPNVDDDSSYYVPGLYGDNAYDMLEYDQYEENQENDQVLCFWAEWSDWSGCNKGYDADNNTDVFQSRTRQYVSLTDPNVECSDSYQQLPDDLQRQTDDQNLWYETFYEQRRTYDDNGQLCTLKTIEAITSFTDNNNNPNQYRDIVILTDESTSITEDNFNMVKIVLKNLINSICGGISKTTNRVSIVRYSASQKLDLDFKRGGSMDRVSQAIDNMRYKPLKNPDYSGSTYTAAALKFVRERVLTEDKGWRNGQTSNGESVSTEILIITDGRSNDPTDFGITLTNEKELLKSKPRNNNLGIYALGIGNVYDQEINELTDGDTNNVFYFPTWKEFGLFGRILAFINQKKEEIVNSSGQNPEDVCLPFTLSEQDKIDLEIFSSSDLQGFVPENGIRRRRRKRSLDFDDIYQFKIEKVPEIAYYKKSLYQEFLKLAENAVKEIDKEYQYFSRKPISFMS